MYRQSRIFERARLDPDRSTLADWVNKTTALLEPLADAIRTALTRMERLRPCLDHGVLEPDNDTAERGMRAIALGRNDCLLVGSEAGGKAAAIACTLIETAKPNAVDPHAWLADTLARPPPQDQQGRRPAPMVVARSAVSPDGCLLRLQTGARSSPDADRAPSQADAQRRR